MNKCFAVTLGVFRYPLTPLKRVEPESKIKVLLFQEDLGGFITFDTEKMISQTSSKASPMFKPI